MEKLNNSCNELWQKPKINVQGPEKEWFVNQVLGKDTLNNAMKNLSAAANLSKIYTNHSIWATVVTVMDENDCPTRHIQATTGHKSESSIKAYAKKISAKKRREICELLQNQMENDEEVQPAPQQQVIQEIQNQAPPPAIEIPNKNPIVDVPQAPTNLPEPPAFDNFVPAPQDFWPENAELQSLDEVNDQGLVQALANIEQENANMGIAPPQAVPVPQIEVQRNNSAFPIALQNNQNPLQQLNVSNVANVSNFQPGNQLPAMYFPNSSVTINYNFNKWRKIRRKIA